MEDKDVEHKLIGKLTVQVHNLFDRLRECNQRIEELESLGNAKADLQVARDQMRSKDQHVHALESSLKRETHNVVILEHQVVVLGGDPMHANVIFIRPTEVEMQITKSSKIEAIKRYRNRTKLGLKESKDAIEEGMAAAAQEERA